jgi:hypothetical protein
MRRNAYLSLEGVGVLSEEIAKQLGMSWLSFDSLVGKPKNLLSPSK